FANLDEFDGRQLPAGQARPGYVQPTRAGTILEGVEGAIKILATPLTAANLINRHAADPQMVAAPDPVASQKSIEIDQLDRSASEEAGGSLQGSFDHAVRVQEYGIALQV